MKYKELQRLCKEQDLSAKGSTAELRERLGMDKLPEPKEVEVKKVVDKGRGFVFTGDKVGGHDPATCKMHGINFELNGRVVYVPEQVAVKLATHSHFTEK